MREFAGEYGRGVRQENVRSKTKELSGTLPYALSMCPTTITASSEESEDITTACQVVDANVALRNTAIRVQTIYHLERRHIGTTVEERSHLSGWQFFWRMYT